MQSKFLVSGLLVFSLFPSFGFSNSSSDPSTTIVGGEKVENLADPVYKHTVRLLVRVVVEDTAENPEAIRGLKISSRCSGTLLDDDIVLTAAHCFPSVMPTRYQNKDITLKLDVAKMDVRVFSYYKVGRDYSGIKATRIVKHPDFDDLWYQKLDPSELWNPSDPINDIAILKLEYSTPLDKSPASFVNIVGEIEEAKSLTLAGFGRSESSNPLEAPQLRKVDVPFRGFLNNDHDFFAGEGDIEVPSEITDPKGGCFGDSGGPAYLVDSAGDHRVAGIIARGPNQKNGGCFAGVTILTDVSRYADFVTTNLQTLSESL